MWFCSKDAERQLQPEWMDDAQLDPRCHRQALCGLARINFWSRAAHSLWKPLCDFYDRGKSPIRVLDVACGGGDVVCRLAKAARRTNRHIEFAGCDISDVAVEHARDKARRCGVNGEFFQLDVLGRPLPGGYDVIMSSLFLHHLQSAQAVQLLQKMTASDSKLILISDLLRSPMGWLLARVGTKLLSRSPVVHFDGPRSVEGAFNRQELEDLLERAGLSQASIRKTWPQRFLVVWERQG
jgi:2-polyprenyl-3-methyl-5-hydroxy-6-metoxy-1,4-benzoquinol methylase